MQKIQPPINDETGVPHDAPVGFVSDPRLIPGDNKIYVEAHWHRAETETEVASEYRGFMSLECAVRCGMPVQPAQPTEQMIDDKVKQALQRLKDNPDLAANELNRISQDPTLQE